MFKIEINVKKIIIQFQSENIGVYVLVPIYKLLKMCKVFLGFERVVS